jgi:hypothetical protein
MSTDDRLLALEAEVKLKRFVPRLRGHEDEVRRLSVHPDVFDWVHAGTSSAQQMHLKSKIRAHFGQFVKGEPIDDKYFMKRISNRSSGQDDFGSSTFQMESRVY